MTYRPGTHWKITIVEEGDGPLDEHGHHVDSRLRAVVMDGKVLTTDAELAGRICALLNASDAEWSQVIACREEQISAADLDGLRARFLASAGKPPVVLPPTPPPVDLRAAARKVNAIRPGVETHTALAVIQALLVMGWAPPPGQPERKPDDPPHSTCVETTRRGSSRREWVCGRDCDYREPERKADQP